MKKAYGKPMLFAESFELVEHIAGDFRVNDNFEGAKFHNSGECRYEDGNISLFLSADHLCDSYLFNNAGLEISIPICSTTLGSKSRFRMFRIWA